MKASIAIHLIVLGTLMAAMSLPINHPLFQVTHSFISRLDSGPKSSCKVSDIGQLNPTYCIHKTFKIRGRLEARTWYVHVP